MRFLIKVPIPTAVENAEVSDPKFNEKLNSLLNELGAQRIFSRRSPERKIVYALFDIQDLSRIFAIAKPISVWLGIKLEFFPETVGKSYFGDVTLPTPKT